jgi:xylan 1,4-beta-xylosidase
MNRRTFLAAAGLGLAGSMAGRMFAEESAQQAKSVIDIDLGRNVGALPHFWEKCAGSDRTVVGLRDQWRQDLIRAQRDFGMQSVRCHGLFDDEMGIAAQGGKSFNFLYVDQIYDFMIEHGVRPFVELSFMPEAFASSANRIFFYKGNISPPRNWQDWYDMVQAFTRHCVQRYGNAEVENWRFEVWNEPNIGFWAGSQEQYFELYKQSVQAIKSVDENLQVGGPATAQLDWIPDLIQYCAGKGLPLDFVSSHVYPNDPQDHIFGRDHMYSYEEVIPRGVAQVKQQVESSAMPRLPMWITEWSSSNPAFIAHTVKECIGLTETMSYWTFSNVFEEGGVPRGAFNNAYGMIGQWGIPHTALHAFALMHELGETQLHASDGPVLATRRSDGSVSILVWNLIPEKGGGMGFLGGNPGEQDRVEGSDLSLQFKLAGLSGRNQVKVSQVNNSVGSAVPAWKAMGSPEYPSADQIKQLRAAAELPAPEMRPLQSGEPADFSIMLPPNGIALLQLEP